MCHSGPRKPAFPRAAKQWDTGSLQHAAAAGGASAGLRRRARPGEVRFASAGKGTGTHIAVEKLNRDLHITALHTPPGATDAITDVIEGTAAGRTAYAMVPIPTATPHIQDGGLVALGVSTVRRSRLLPDVPPLAEAGAEGFDFPIWYGIWAPARNPHEIVSKLARDISNALATAELLEWLNRHDADPMRMTQTSSRPSSKANVNAQRCCCPPTERHGRLQRIRTMQRAAPVGIGRFISVQKTVGRSGPS